MRPRRLVMEGFLAYRHRAEIDFTDADLFVLSGPTGSGKSSVIDGMTFALYGTIPRLDDRRTVAPVISAQSDRARVSFDFSVGDQSFTAVRLVERTKGGATTTEARLQSGEKVLAGSADEVSERVVELLGLSYDHFTKAVVLPQGAFADFLTDRPRDRQALLRALLDIGLFEQVMQLANARARTAEVRVEGFEESLAKLDVPTPEEVAASRQRLDLLVEAATQLPDRLETMSRLETALTRARETRAGAAEALARLTAVAPPDDLESLDGDRLAARDRVEAAQAALAEARNASKAVEAALAAWPAIAQLESWQADRARRAELTGNLAALDLAALSDRVERAAAERDRARAEVDRLRVDHSAHELRRGLVVGEPCPVCNAVVASVDLAPGGPLTPIEDAMARVSGLETAASEARDRLKVAEGQANEIDRLLAEIDERVSAAPPPEELDQAAATVRELLAGEMACRQAEAAAQTEVEAARDALSRLDERASGLLASLLAARDGVAAEEPPIPGDDAVEGWRVFETWRIGRVEKIESELEGLDEGVAIAESALAAFWVELRAWLGALGVESSGSPELDLALATERSRTEINELEKRTAEAAELSRALDEEMIRARVASSLGTHLRSNNFEAWLLEEAMETLVEGANRLLADLSAGAYSLLARESQFEVIDHRNADLTRTTRGLSGGEVFLVALSLALSMADQLAELTGTASRLESVFLDEGFGSLDQESLDVVASVLDELVGRGRTVGLVTHVRELAERIPVRFEVSKGPESATIERMLG
jgi:exonuclease SbcC